MHELRASHLTRVHRRGGQEVRALDDVSLTIRPGAFVTVTGPSGSGKSTLLQLLGLLDRPTEGSVLLEGADTAAYDDQQRARCRRTVFGFVFQSFQLLAGLSAWENVAMPRLLDGTPLRASRARAVELLDAAGLADRVEHRPDELSGGEQQRVAIARALVADPPVVLADEPTGALDQATSLEVTDLLRRLTVDCGRSLVLVTHNPVVASTPGATQVQLRDGHVVEETRGDPEPGRTVDPEAVS